MGLMTKKSIAVLQSEAAGESTEHTLRRALGALNLTTLGIGAIIGAGIFVLTGTAAAQYAGPAIVISFIVSGLGCLFAGLCYAEFASMIPIAGRFTTAPVCENPAGAMRALVTGSILAISWYWYGALVNVSGMWSPN